MEVDTKSSLSGIVGHSISTFTLFKFDNHSESKKDDSSSSSSNESNLKYNVNSFDNVLNSSSSDTLNQTTNQANSESSQSQHSNNNLKSLNHNDNNEVSFNRFVSNVHIDEVRSLLYGSWDPEHSEQMWKEINGPESEDNIVFTNCQVVREEDLIKAGKYLDVKLCTNHINDFVNYDVMSIIKKEKQNENEKELEKKESIFEYNNKYVILFGGVHLNEEHCSEKFTNIFTLLKAKNKLEFTNGLYFSEAESFRSNWEQLDNSNTPEPRAFHASCVLYSNLNSPVLAVSGGLGGLGNNKTLLDTELYLLNLSRTTLQWKVFKTTGSNPPKRYGHTMCQVGNFLLMFGGTDGTKLYNDLWSLNVNDGSYEVPGEQTRNSWYIVEYDGTGPSPRAFHSCCKLGISSNSPMVVYGGMNYVDSLRNRMYALHFGKEDKMKWSILPVYVKSPSETRAFHSMTYVDKKFVITGGEDMKNECNTNMKSLAYSLDNKSFLYIEDTVGLAGHKSWAAFGMVYHWGGLTNHGGKVSFDESISISNPLTYSEDSNIEEIYYKYIRFASMNSQYDTTRSESETKGVETEYKNNNENELDKKEYKSKTSYECVNNNNNVEGRLVDRMNVLGSQLNMGSSYSKELNTTSSNLGKLETNGSLIISNDKELATSTNSNTSDDVTPTSSYGGRPRRSAALKCLSAIELDNKRHKELEKGDFKK